MKIKVKRINPNIEFPKIINKGEWIDLRASEEMVFNAPQALARKKIKIHGELTSVRDVEFDTKLIPLGIAMELPKGYEAHILPRSGTFKNFGIIMNNSQGIIDSSYCGDDDEWKFSATALMHSRIQEGDRICQFRVMLSQKATLWQKIKWVFSSKIKLVEVDHLGNKNRNGFSSTGVK